ncbi:hypothetical protein [Bosea sp. LjRoot237]|uniref:hypothetical protein n=1 Tax=Bosea sp. LjRoot237 TaxID=3342292 RepID=UPI003ED06241
MLVATKSGVVVVAAFSFLAGSAAVFIAKAIGDAWARWTDKSDPLDDPRNWH